MYVIGDFAVNPLISLAFTSVARLRGTGDIERIVTMRHLATVVDRLEQTAEMQTVAVGDHRFDLFGAQRVADGTDVQLSSSPESAAGIAEALLYLAAWDARGYCIAKDGESREAADSRVGETIARLYAHSIDRVRILADGELEEVRGHAPRDRPGRRVDVHRNFRYGKSSVTLKNPREAAYRASEDRVIVREGVGSLVREALLSEGEESLLAGRAAAERVYVKETRYEFFIKPWSIVAASPRQFLEDMRAARRIYAGGNVLDELSGPAN